MKARLLCAAEFAPSAGDELAGTTASADTVIENESAWRLVIAGIAVPADAECAEKSGKPLVMSPEEESAQLQAYQMVELGIFDPDDMAAFRRGEMVGYDENGHWIPGPNYVETTDTEEETDDIASGDDVVIEGL